MSDYRVKEMHLTLQGEGANTGMAVVLLRFAGCNLSCSWCDTDHTGTDGFKGGVYHDSRELADQVLSMWRGTGSNPSVLCTGGEPLLQMDSSLLREFTRRNTSVYLETNGTICLPEGIHWVCVSPKDEKAVVTSGDEVKLVWPSGHLDPDRWAAEDFRHFLLQPLFNDDYAGNLEACIEYCKKNPRWRLSLQTQRYAGFH